MLLTIAAMALTAWQAYNATSDDQRERVVKLEVKVDYLSAAVSKLEGALKP